MRHSARGLNMQISTVDVIRCVNVQAIVASERKKRRSGKFFDNGGPVIGSCKTPLTQKALSCLFFRNTKSEEHFVSDLFGYTGPTAKRPMRPCYVPFISNNVAIDGFFNSRDPQQWRCLS